MRERRRILFVFAWLVVGGEETEVRLLAQNLDAELYQIDVVACFRKEGMPEQSQRQLQDLGIDVDCTPYNLSFQDTVAYLARKIAGYDLVVSCQNVADIYPALDRARLRPPLIEHGGLVSEALAGPKHFTARYVGVCRSIRDAAASHMPGREAHAVEIPSMVDLSEFDGSQRGAYRAKLEVPADTPLIGWAGRLDRKKRVEDFIEAAALVRERAPSARFVVIGGPDAFMPDYADALKDLAIARGLDGRLSFLGDRTDVPQLLSALDILAWLSEGEGMPHIIAEAGAARLAVIATRDNGSMQQIEDGHSGVFVPHGAPRAVADAMLDLIADPARRTALGAALRRKVETEFSAEVVVPKWQLLIEQVLAEQPLEKPTPKLFRSFLQGGFECSTHRRGDGARLDVIAATEHDRRAAADYRQLSRHGIHTVRDGLRWHLIEAAPNRYDWSSALPMIRAAEKNRTQVIWDLMHYGWPSDTDIWKPEFVDRFARFARAAAQLISNETASTPFYCPINEISFLAWAGGDVGYLNPFVRARGFELKVQLVRAALAAIEAIWDVAPAARIVHSDPIINVVADARDPNTRPAASMHTSSQYEAWDMLGGLAWPQLGGSMRHLDIVGVNYYHKNQWIHNGAVLDVGDRRYKPLRSLLAETYARYGRPIFVAETGIEDARRPAWLSYVADEVRAAMKRGVPLEGLCLYPIVNHPGWDDDRDCPNGLFEALQFADAQRPTYQPLADEIRRQQSRGF